jgi:fatty acid desaturase
MNDRNPYRFPGCENLRLDCISDFVSVILSGRINDTNYCLYEARRSGKIRSLFEKLSVAPSPSPQSRKAFYSMWATQGLRIRILDSNSTGRRSKRSAAKEVLITRQLNSMFGLGPAYLFIVQHRLPVGLMRAGWQPWLSAMATNVAIATLVITMIWLVGVVPFVLVHLPMVLLAASIGVWLFYVQHQFADTTWDRDSVWSLHEAALHGSSHYDLPSVMCWFTANIGVHHIHHLCSRIPYYRLPLVLRDYPELGVIGRLTLVQSFRCVRLVLWDETLQRLVSFHEVRKRYALV